jgi:hypothetical protein
MAFSRYGSGDRVFAGKFQPKPHLSRLYTKKRRVFQEVPRFGRSYPFHRPGGIFPVFK